MTIGVDWSFIDRHEIPTDFGYAIPKDEKSGITIVSGFDLGKHSKDQINELPISSSLKEKLKPFTKLTGARARDALYSAPEAFDPRIPIASQIKKPVVRVVSTGATSAYVLKSVYDVLSLSKTEVTELTAAVRNVKLKIVADAFNRATAPKGKHFTSTPPTCQTAVISFCWQYGEYIWKLKKTDRRRQYWDLVAGSNWSDAIELILRDFMGPSEKSFERRRLEEVWLLMLGLGKQQPGPRLKRLLFKAAEQSRTA